MIRNGLFFLRAHHSALLLEPCNDPFNRLVEVGHLDRIFALPRCQQRRLVDDIRQIRADEPRRLCSYKTEIDSRSEVDFFGVQLENLFPALDIRAVHQHLTVESPMSYYRGIETPQTYTLSLHDALPI